MEKKAKKELPISSFQKKMETPTFRKMVLLGLVAAVLIYDFSILSMDNKISREPDYAGAVRRNKNPWEKDVRSLVKGSPMEKMIPYISQKEKRVAAFLVSIAKKESNWGKRSPRLNGNDCFNYWGYRGQSGEITRDGFTCFKNPKQAVDTVSRRMNDLIYKSNLDTPQKLVVWKCGWDCSWDNPIAVKKWASDVDYYFQKFYE
jgi:hypothetical protein